MAGYPQTHPASAGSSAGMGYIRFIHTILMVANVQYATSVREPTLTSVSHHRLSHRARYRDGGDFPVGLNPPRVMISARGLIAKPGILACLPRASAVPCRAMPLTVLSVQKGVAVNGSEASPQNRGFPPIPSSSALHGACSSSGMCTGQPLHPPADFMCDSEERLSGTIVQVKYHTAIATRCRLVQGIRNSNHSGRRGCEAYLADAKIQGPP